MLRGTHVSIKYLIIMLTSSFRESNAALKSALIRTRSEESSSLSSSPKSPRSPGSLRYQLPVFRGTREASDIHICVLCLKALMNNAVSAAVVVTKRERWGRKVWDCHPHVRL